MMLVWIRVATVNMVSSQSWEYILEVGPITFADGFDMGNYRNKGKSLLLVLIYY